MTAVPYQSSLSTLTPGSFFRQYQLLEQIGVGGQGVVWSALNKSQNHICAVKFNEISDTDQAKAEDALAEHQFEKLIELRHSHILPFQDYGFENNLRFTTSPYVAGGTLAQKIKAIPLSIDDILRYGMEIASALDYLHSHGVIHRDLKSANILLDLGSHTYLADFGLARIISTSTLAFHTGHGTPPYAPPEQIQSKAITLKSDIFSFGILLFELFTGQLPWNGKKQLGMEQLNSKQELPDPREYSMNLPARIPDVLRRITSADPNLRPQSANEAMKMICYVFDVPFTPLPGEIQVDEQAVRSRDVDILLKEGLDHWKSTDGRFIIGLTKFALIDLKYKKSNTDIFNRFMLSQALTYGYKDEHWWSSVSNPRERLLVSSILLGKENETIASRVIGHLTNDTEIRASAKGLPQSMTSSLLALGMKTNDAILRQQVFEAIRILTRPANTWNDSLLNPDQIKHLGNLALEDSEFGDTTAKLIGHIRSSPAVQVILNHSSEDRKNTALLLVQQEAESLPTFVQGSVRLKLSLEWILQRLIQQPVNLIGGYVLAFLGAALGIGIQVYLTYNLPDFFDIDRITISLERGLIVGSIFGLGIFLAKVITERFPTVNIIPRIIFGTIAGSMGLNIAILIFHILFLNTTPKGFLVTLGCILIALTFSIGGLISSRLIRIFLTSISVFVAIIGTWWFHINFAISSVELTPIFKYANDWPLIQISFTALAVSLAIGIFGNLVSLTIKDE